jgi:hypothetical protein
METLARAGYGLLVLMNHFSFRDPPQVLSMLFSSELLRTRPVLAPTAAHQANAAVRAIADIFGIELCLIVTAESVARKGLDPSQGQTPMDYAREATNTLSEGGIVLLAPQTTRMPSLGVPTARPVSLLLAQARRKRLHNVALVCLGLGISGVSDYDLGAVGGFNLRRHYEARLGRVFTLDEALQEAGSLRAMDAWIFTQLRDLVPASYARGNPT